MQIVLTRRGKAGGGPIRQRLQIDTIHMGGVTLWADFFESGYIVVMPYTIQDVRN